MPNREIVPETPANMLETAISMIAFGCRLDALAGLLPRKRRDRGAGELGVDRHRVVAEAGMADEAEG